MAQQRQEMDHSRELSPRLDPKRGNATIGYGRDDTDLMEAILDHQVSPIRNGFGVFGKTGSMGVYGENALSLHGYPPCIARVEGTGERTQVMDSTEDFSSSSQPGRL
jgi:hypothetical protein